MEESPCVNMRVTDPVLQGLHMELGIKVSLQKGSTSCLQYHNRREEDEAPTGSSLYALSMFDERVARYM
jgi:hypothetical protein